MKRRNHTPATLATLAAIDSNSLYNSSLSRAIEREERAAAAEMAEERARAAELHALNVSEDFDVDAEIDAMTAAEFAALAGIESDPAYMAAVAAAIEREARA